MEHIVRLGILLLFLASCGTKQPKPAAATAPKSDTETTQPASTAEPNMWKLASYAGDIGDNKNASYITNTFAIWGNYRIPTTDNTDLKVKFLVDRVSFCIKLYEYGKKVVKKGDETGYKITILSQGVEPLVITAKNVSDRIFINETDARKIIELFNRGEKITFSMTNDSKTLPAYYGFTLDHPGGFNELYAKLKN